VLKDSKRGGGYLKINKKFANDDKTVRELFRICQFLKNNYFCSKILTVHVGVGGNSQTLPHHHHLQRRDSDQSDSPSEPSKPVLRKHGKLITFFRSFILSRPTRGKLKKRGILKERVFSCDLGEYLLNSGQEGRKPTFSLLVSHF